MDYTELVNELLRTTQILRKNMIGNEGRAFIETAFPNGATEQQIEELLEGLYPWVFGPKSIMHALIKLTTLNRALCGSDVYNLLVIAHRLDKTGAIKLAYETFTGESRKLPEPNLLMMADIPPMI